MEAERINSASAPASSQPARGSAATEATLPLLTRDVANRFLYFERALERVRTIEGDVVECGVGWGRSLLAWALLVSLRSEPRHIWGFDSFEGFPEPSPEDRSPRDVHRGEWKTDPTSVRRMLEVSGLEQVFLDDRVTLVKGFFADTLPVHRGGPVAVLHVDADLYRSYLDALTNVYPRVARGGVILFDEYLEPRDLMKFPGARRAIDEFMAGREPIERDAATGKYFAVRA